MLILVIEKLQNLIKRMLFRPKIYAKLVYRDKKIIANTSWLLTEKITRVACNLFVNVWVARYLGVKDFGIISYVITYNSIFQPIVNLGLPATSLKEFSQRPEEDNTIAGAIFRLTLFSGIIVSIICVISAFFIQEEGSVTKLIGIVSITNIFQAFNVIDFWFISEDKSKFSFLSKNISLLSSTLIKVSMILCKAPLSYFALAIVAESMIVALTLIYFYQSQKRSIYNWNWSRNFAIKLIKESWPLILSEFSILIYLKTDQLMISKFLGNSELGIYAAAAKISEGWFMIPAAILSATSSSIYLAKRNNENMLFEKKILHLNRLLFYAGAIILVIVSWNSSFIIKTIYGEEFLEASQILTVHIWGTPFVFMSYAASPWFLGGGLQKYAFHRHFAGAFINIVLNMVLIPRVGGLGAAVSTVISYSISGFLIHALIPKTRGLFKLQVSSIFFTQY